MCQVWLYFTVDGNGHAFILGPSTITGLVPWTGLVDLELLKLFANLFPGMNSNS